MKGIAEALAVLVEAYRVTDLSEATILTYSRALEKIPPVLLRPMVDRCLETRKYFPRIMELREDAEAVRQAYFQKNPYVSCGGCCGGWLIQEQETDDGFKYGYATRCACHGAYLAKVNALGLGHEPLALAAGDEP